MFRIPITKGQPRSSMAKLASFFYQRQCANVHASSGLLHVQMALEYCDIIFAVQYRWQT